MNSSEPIWSISEVNRAMRELVEGSLMPFWLTGEVGTITLHRSGHAYFTLKDQKSQLRACWFNGVSECRRLGIGNGSMIEAYGQLGVYETRGEYQFTIRKMRTAGLGELQRRFEELKRKLDAEGLFDEKRKRPIPLLPGRIGVVTSPSGAAIRDFLQIVNRRFPNVTIRIYPCLVQGAEAAAQVAAGVEFFNRADAADVIVVTRGGGSMEDLWPFNEEVVARSVAASRIPVISAVGHEIDFTICDFAADLRVPTPSAAAELVIGAREELSQRLKRASGTLANLLRLATARLRARLNRAVGSYTLRDPRRMLENPSRKLDELEMRSFHAVERMTTVWQNRLRQAETALNALNPAGQLKRGYALVWDPDEKRHISTSRQPAGKRLELRFADGTLPVITDRPPKE